MMDAPPVIIEIKRTERHDIKAEVTEYVARLLCRAAGEEPDADVRYGDNVMHTVHLPYPMNLRWYKYREAAIEQLQNLFKAP